MSAGEAIDLGLSVKWASYNVGATAPEEYGSYVAWGETEEKIDYSLSTYKYCDGSEHSMNKYCKNPAYGTVDKKTTLEVSDDVATVKWGGTWRMPTYDEQIELHNNCTWQYTTINGVNGYQVTGPNGNSIFLPAAGYRYETDVNGQNSDGYYWSSSLNDNYGFSAYFLYFNDNAYYYHNDTPRYRALPVRPVCP